MVTALPHQTPATCAVTHRVTDAFHVPNTRYRAWHVRALPALAKGMPTLSSILEVNMEMASHLQGRGLMCSDAYLSTLLH